MIIYCSNVEPQIFQDITENCSYGTDSKQFILIPNNFSFQNFCESLDLQNDASFGSNDDEYNSASVPFSAPKVVRFTSTFWLVFEIFRVI